MTTNKQELYNKIRARINELVPRLKETKIYNYTGKKDGFCDYIELHLEHILEAIENSKNVWLGFELREIWISFLEDYNLSLSLENQSLETLESLDKLLN